MTTSAVNTEAWSFAKDPGGGFFSLSSLRDTCIQCARISVGFVLRGAGPEDLPAAPFPIQRGEVTAPPAGCMSHYRAGGPYLRLNKSHIRAYIRIVQSGADYSRQNNYNCQRSAER